MKRPTKQLLDDLLEDSASPEFRGTLMNKTMHSARQRKRMRYFNMAMGVIALAGIFAFTFQEMREPAASPKQFHPPILSAASAPSLNPVQVVRTKPDSLKNVTGSDSSFSTLKVVETSESDRPREINDQELLALAADRPMVLIHEGVHQSALIFQNPKDERGLLVQ